MKKIIYSIILLLSFGCLNTVFAQTLSAGDVVINEFMASNDSLSGIFDSAGQFDDWIELYNTTTATVDLSNAYLTDNKNLPQKWAFPSGTTISPDGYLIIWADEDGSQAGLHANFKLSKLGEFIMLSDNSTVFDSITFGVQITNLTASRVPNGTGDFIIQNPTFNANNEGPSPVVEINGKVHQINIYPNPATDFLNIEFDAFPEQGLAFTLFNSVGQKIGHQQITEARTTLSTSNLMPGIYFLVIIENQNEKILLKESVFIH